MKRLLPELPRIFRRSLKVKSLFMNILAISPLNSKILRSILSKLLIPKIEIKKNFARSTRSKGGFGAKRQLSPYSGIFYH